jgi:hypothetical protein
MTELIEAEPEAIALPGVEALALIDEALYELRSTNLIETSKMMDYLLDIRLLVREATGQVER